MVEQRPEKPRVRSSILRLGTISPSTPYVFTYSLRNHCINAAVCLLSCSFLMPNFSLIMNRTNGAETKKAPLIAGPFGYIQKNTACRIYSLSNNPNWVIFSPGKGTG